MLGVYRLEKANIEYDVLAFFAAIGTTISYIANGIGWPFVVLLILMAVDFSTGLMVGYVRKELSSSVGTKGFIKKLYIIILIGTVFLIEKKLLNSPGYIGDGATIAYIFIEFISVAENGGKLGAPIPPQIKTLIQILKERSEEDDRSSDINQKK